MKKIIALSVFVFAMLISTSSVVAQNKIEINAAASKKAESLNTYIKFNTDQKEDVYQAFKDYFTAKASLQTNSTSIKKANNRLESKLKEILTEEQFKRYISRKKDNQ